MEIQNRELHRIVLTAIIQKHGQFLICRRDMNKKAFPGMWTVPGGGLEVDDYINTPKTNSDSWYFPVTNTLRREVKEEVNLEIDNIKYLLDITFIRSDGIPVVILSYYCDYKSGEVNLNQESIDYKWVSFEEAKEYKLVPGLLGELEMVDKILNGEDINKIKYKNI